MRRYQQQRVLGLRPRCRENEKLFAILMNLSQNYLKETPSTSQIKIVQKILIRLSKYSLEEPRILNKIKSINIIIGEHLACNLKTARYCLFSTFSYIFFLLLLVNYLLIIFLFSFAWKKTTRFFECRFKKVKKKITLGDAMCNNAKCQMLKNYRKVLPSTEENGKHGCRMLPW